MIDLGGVDGAAIAPEFAKLWTIDRLPGASRERRWPRLIAGGPWWEAVLVDELPWNGSTMPEYGDG